MTVSEPHEYPTKPLILASQSIYRQQQLKQLAVSFTTQAAPIDEQLIQTELPSARAQRLADAKAQYVQQQNPQAVVIGSDQVCACGEVIFRKPKNRATNREHLQTFSGQEVLFYTALSVFAGGHEIQNHINKTRVQFRALTDGEIFRYVDTEQAFDCAGGFKMECLGLSLMTSVHSNDPSALMGLPLIQLSQFLRQLGYVIP